MYHNVSHLLSRLINSPLSPRQIYFAGSNGLVPDPVYQIGFSQLGIMLEGEFIGISAEAVLVPNDALYIPADGRNFPQWQAPATTLSVPSGKQ